MESRAESDVFRRGVPLPFTEFQRDIQLAWPARRARSSRMDRINCKLGSNLRRVMLCR